MFTNQDLCHGLTRAGEPCRRHPIKGSSYCYQHQPTGSERQNQRILTFLSDHREFLAGVFAGAVSDPVAQDLYDYMKGKLNLEFMIPPVPKKDDRKELTQRYLENRSYESLARLIGYLRIGMSRDEVEEIVGKPSYTPIGGQDYYSTDIRYLTLVVEYRRFPRPFEIVLRHDLKYTGRLESIYLSWVYE